MEFLRFKALSPILREQGSRCVALIVLSRFRLVVEACASSGRWQDRKFHNAWRDDSHVLYRERSLRPENKR